MFVIDSPAWTQTVVPNLPIKHRDEYILRLAEFAPKTTWLEAKQVIWGWRQAYYAFPFIQIPENFPSLDYEDHVISRSNAVSPVPISIHGKCTNYELVPEPPIITMQEQPKESLSVAALGVAVIGGLGFLVGLMF